MLLIGVLLWSSVGAGVLQSDFGAGFRVVGSLQQVGAVAAALLSFSLICIACLSSMVCVIWIEAASLLFLGQLFCLLCLYHWHSTLGVVTLTFVFCVCCWFLGCLCRW